MIENINPLTTALVVLISDAYFPSWTSLTFRLSYWMQQHQLGYIVLEILSNPKEFQTMKKKHDKADKVGN